MKKLFLIFLAVFVVQVAIAQQKKIDTLRLALKNAQTDTEKYKAMHDLGALYVLNHTDSAIIIYQQAYLLVEKHNWLRPEGVCLNNMSVAYQNAGDYTTAIQNYLAAIKIDERLHDLALESTVNLNLGNIYQDEGESKEAEYYERKAIKQLQAYALSHPLSLNDKNNMVSQFLNLSNDFISEHRADSAGKYLNIAIALCKKYNITPAVCYGDLGNLATLSGQYKRALEYYHKASARDAALGEDDYVVSDYIDMGECFNKMKEQDSAKFYEKKALAIAQADDIKDNIISAAKDLYTYYDQDHNTTEAYKYFKLATATKDSIYNQNKVRQVLTIGFNEKLREREVAEEEVQYQDKVRTYMLTGGMVVLLLIAGIFWRNSNQRKKANHLLSKQKREIEEQRDQTNKALTELKLTQNQLIQSEKMASLGELTAGIAHEIQNPLNFVNNFSEVSVELLDEMDEELDKGDIQEAKSIGADLKQNLEKIKHHGKRADFIVKGMLEHSRTNTGEKQLTDMNVLCDEFLKLSFHGLRAKDKSFNAEMITHFDPELPKVNVSQQDMGRVLLNLYNNAFYAVNQKLKTAGVDYKPEVSVSTFSESGKVVIKVKDNGVGIPDAIKEKIMQPFFTTKPTGEGTGLGLSLTYDMVVKGHGGSIDVYTKEDEYTEFIIRLPVLK